MTILDIESTIFQTGKSQSQCKSYGSILHTLATGWLIGKYTLDQYKCCRKLILREVYSFWWCSVHANKQQWTLHCPTRCWSLLHWDLFSSSKNRSPHNISQNDVCGSQDVTVLNYCGKTAYDFKLFWCPFWKWKYKKKSQKDEIVLIQIYFE